MATEYDVCPRCGKKVTRDDTKIESFLMQIEGDVCMICFSRDTILPAVWYTYLTAKERRVLERQHGLQPYIPSANFSVQEDI